MKRIKAFVLAALMLCSLAALAGCEAGDQTTAATTLSKTAVYTVKITDPLGNPVDSTVGVKFLKGGEQAGMAMTNAEGIASKELERDNYTLVLTFTDIDHTYCYDTAAAVLTPTDTELEIVVAYEMGTGGIKLALGREDTPAYTLQFAGEALTVTGLLEDAVDGTYTYISDDSGITVEQNKTVIISIYKNLMGEYVFHCKGLADSHRVVDAAGNAVTELTDGVYTVMSNERTAYDVLAGSTKVPLATAGRNYFLFTPDMAGIYEISATGADVTAGYYGSPYNVYNDSIAAVENGKMTVTVSSGMIGTGNTGTAQMVLGIDAAAAGECYLNIVRVGDAPASMEWENYAATYKPAKYSLGTGLTIQEFDLSAATYNLVYNETDKYYHLNSADGPVVLVRLLAPNDYTGFAFGNILLGANIGVYYFDDAGEISRKVLYNDCVQAYLGEISGSGENVHFTGGMCDDTYGVYPLTKDLETVIKTYGAYYGYWNSESVNYVLGSVSGLNEENAWLFLCCYAE